MYLNRWKNFIIGFLIFLAIYQTNVLWFNNYFNNKNFNRVNIQNETLFLTDSILINTGDNKFIRKFNNISNSEYKRIFDETIYLAIKNGRFEFIEKYNLDNILNNKCVIYTYDFIINTKYVKDIFNIKSKHFSKLDNFDRIIIIPSKDLNYEIKVVFLSSKSLKAYEVLYKKESVNQKILDTIEDFKYLENREFYFVSSQEGLEQYFNQNEFLPKAKLDSLYIDNIKATNPLENGGGILLSESEKYVDVFFENPAIKSSLFINNTYTYNDENIIVKYYPDGILEYVEYKSNISKNNKESAYKIAVNFLKKDTNIKNEYYLSNYIEDIDKTTFYFDYKINNFPIMLSESFKKKIDMKSIIEVTVEDGRVSKYKRLIYNFELSQDYKVLKQDFQMLLDDKQKLDRMYLSYIFDNPEEDISIKWVLDNEDNILIKEAS